MKFNLPFFKRNPDKQRALALAEQSARFYDIAAARGGVAVRGRTKTGYKRRNKIKGKFHGPTLRRSEPRLKKAKYVPGENGPSQVAERIAYDYGHVVNRNERKVLAAARLFPMRLYPNGG